MKIGKHWKTIRMVFQEALASSLHYAIATVNEDGSPHVTPIGALFLRGDRTGFYFDVFTSKMSANLARDPRVCVLAVNSSVDYWQKSMFAGRCELPPSFRLTGRVGEKRKATKEELGLWRKHVAFAEGMRGYDMLWKDMNCVRDITFDGLRQGAFVGDRRRARPHGGDDKGPRDGMNFINMCLSCPSVSSKIRMDSPETEVFSALFSDTNP